MTEDDNDEGTGANHDTSLKVYETNIGHIYANHFPYLFPHLVVWHLKPFSSLHCFWHIWQYHRSFCRPMDLILFPMAFGVRASCFGIFDKFHAEGQGRGDA